MPAYQLPDWDTGLCGPHRSACTSSSLLVVAIIFLSFRTIWDDLLPTQGMNSLSRISESLVVYRITAVLGLEILILVRGGVSLLLGLDLSESFKSFKSSRTSAGSYSLFFILRSMLSTNLDVLTMRALLICPSCRYQSQIRLFWLTRWVGRPRPVIAIAFDLLLTTVIALLGCASSRVNRFRSFFVLAMTSLFFINVIAAGSSWYVIRHLRSCLKEIRLESHPSARATLCNLMLSPPTSDIKTLRIFSVQMTCLTAMTKSMLLVFVLLKKLRLLYRWRDAHKSKNQVLKPVFVFWSCNGLSATINAAATGPCAKGSGSNSSLSLLLDAA